MGEAYRICIVDDHASARETLRAYAEDYARERNVQVLVSVFCDALDFLESYAGNFDFIFMDIDLPHLSGMDAIRRLRAANSRAIVIFVTHMAQYALKGYEVDALDFIVKPVRREEFFAKFDRAVERFGTIEGGAVWITESGKRRRLRTTAIKYLEVVHHSVIYHTTEGDFVTYDQLNNAMAALAGEPFALCNRCFFVNLRFVTQIDRYTVTVAGEDLQISRSKKREFMDRLSEFLGEK